MTTSSENTFEMTSSSKLTGRAFYESLGSPKMILAPMVDQSEFAWRLLTRSFMTSNNPNKLLAYSPMLHARMFRETTKFREHHFQPTRKGLGDEQCKNATVPASDLYLDGNPSNDRPLFVQFCANDPQDFLEAAKYVQPYCDAVDLNLGCPQGIARRGSYGAFLQEDWDRIHQLIHTLHENLSIPVTAKMRALETKEKTLEYAKVILSAGASILTVHGRQRDQKGHNTGLADWSVIRYLRENLPPETVLFANGNILRYADIQACLDVTGADGVMSAEGNLYDPSIFSPPPERIFMSRDYFHSRDGKRSGWRMDAVFRRYLDIIYKDVLERPPPKRKPLFMPSDLREGLLKNGASHESARLDGTPKATVKAANDEPPSKKRKMETPSKLQYERPTIPSILAMQPHLFHLLRPLVASRHEVRDALARCKAGDFDAFENVLSLTEAATKEGLLEYEANPLKYAFDEANTSTEDQGRHHESSGEDERIQGIWSAESSVAAVRACKRPWWVCQPYVRPLPKEALEKGSMQIGKKERKRLDAERARADEKRKNLMQKEREALDVQDGSARADVAGEAVACG
ncbi:hypothetical protein MMC25_005195 [Agyrium rufum]|nr:hypothetical protein [Agyrium rufum]